MAKTETTKRLERLLERQFDYQSEFYVFECTIGWKGEEIVDCIMYDSFRDTYCYEIKQSKADFHSKSRLTFIGNKNYFVMPLSLYEQVKNEIPKEIGVYVAINPGPPVTDGFFQLYCIKAAKRQELKADKEVILSSMLRSMQRDRYKRPSVLQGE